MCSKSKLKPFKLEIQVSFKQPYQASQHPEKLEFELWYGLIFKLEHITRENVLVVWLSKALFLFHEFLFAQKLKCYFLFLHRG